VTAIGVKGYRFESCLAITTASLILFNLSQEHCRFLGISTNDPFLGVRAAIGDGDSLTFTSMKSVLPWKLSPCAIASPYTTFLKSIYPCSTSVWTSCTRSPWPTSMPSKPLSNLPSMGGYRIRTHVPLRDEIDKLASKPVFCFFQLSAHSATSQIEKFMFGNRTKVAQWLFLFVE